MGWRVHSSGPPPFPVSALHCPLPAGVTQVPGTGFKLCCSGLAPGGTGGAQLWIQPISPALAGIFFTRTTTRDAPSVPLTVVWLLSHVRLLSDRNPPWDFPGRNPGLGCRFLLCFLLNPWVFSGVFCFYFISLCSLFGEGRKGSEVFEVQE